MKKYKIKEFSYKQISDFFCYNSIHLTKEILIKKYDENITIYYGDIHLLRFKVHEHRGCCGILDIYDLEIDGSEDYKHRGYTNLVFQLIDIYIRKYQYTVGMLTAVTKYSKNEEYECNKLEILKMQHLLKKYGWKKIKSFINKGSTGNTVGIYTKTFN